VVANSAGRHFRASSGSVTEFNIMKNKRISSCGAATEDLLHQVAGSDNLRKRMAVEMENA